ncbi:MAG TPA: DNA ligase D [Burkholderiales bacterium]|nr:DNA ligase D [Burkholderiales bacterium]
MTDRLERYREMRDFSRTPEPAGRTKKADGALNYYIQRHDATRLHYDFRLELDGVLKSWAVPKGPSFNPADKRLAVQTEDHPLDYGEFEGTIPEKQYGAGDVLLWDRGVWTPEDRDPRAALRKGTLHFRLQGEKLRGSWVLTRLRDKKNWLLIKRNDENASTELDIVEEHPESVKRAPKKSRRAAKAKLPAFVTPQLATLVTAPPKSGNWVYEVKHDGYRMLARISSEVRLFTRSGNDWTAKLPHLAKAIEKLGLSNTWLDGEIVVPGADGRASFQALQNAFDAGSDAKIVYYVFDAPFLDGKDQRALPLTTRKQKLKAEFSANTHVRFSEDLTGSAAEVLEHACKLKLEGLIGKQADAVYVAGRSKSWIKLKCRQQQDFVIAGYTAPKGSRSGFGALLLGVYEKPRKLVYAGKVGTGFDDDRLSTLSNKFSSLKSKESPLENPPREKGITWLRPKLVAQVEFAERTNEGIVRQGSFLGLREDIPPKQVGVEKAEAPPASPPAQIRITHPERLIWPSLKITKADLVRYYAEVGDWMLPHAANRPLTLVRCPDGAEAKCFYQRHLGMGASPGELKQIDRARSSKGKYLYLDTKNGILSAVQNGAVEFHTWGASIPDIQHPDRITMDLDPGPDIEWSDLVRGTRLTRTLLEKLGLKCFLKTTGGKGLHVVAPLEPKLPWDEVKEFTRLVAEFLVKAEPKLFVAEMAKAKRTGRVYVDYLRNAETASAVAAYSARARKEAGVSTPLEWDELGRADLREKFTVLTLPKRLAKLTLDPWAEYSSTRQSITKAMMSALSR